MDRAQNWHRLSVLLFLLAFSSCATVSGLRQNVLISTDLDYAELQQDKNAAVPVPGVLSLRRKKHTNLILSRSGKELKFTPETSFRWMDSILGNALWGLIHPYYAVAGLGVDLLSGAAWSFDDHMHFEFLPERKSVPLLPTRIAVFPPKGRSEFVSDEMADEIEKLISSRYPEAEVIGYQSQYSLYAIHGEDNQSQSQGSVRVALLKDLNASHILESRYELSGDTYLLDLSLVDHLHNRVVDEFQARVEVAALESTSKPLSFFRSILLSLVPNTLGIGSFSNTSGILSLGQSSYVTNAENDYETNGLSLTLTTIEDRRIGNYVQAYAKLVPLYGVFAERLSVVQESYLIGEEVLSEGEFRVLSGELGAGGQIGLRVGRADYSVYLGYLGSLSYVQYEAVRSGTGTVFEPMTAVGMNFSFFLTERIRARLVLESRQNPQGKWDDITSDAFAEKVSSSVRWGTRGGFIIEYYFPEIRGWTSQTARSL